MLKNIKRIGTAGSDAGDRKRQAAKANPEYKKAKKERKNQGGLTIVKKNNKVKKVLSRSKSNSSSSSSSYSERSKSRNSS